MSKFIQVTLRDKTNHNYQYINVNCIYAIEEDGGCCKLVMSFRDEVLVLTETVDEFLARLRGND